MSEANVNPVAVVRAQLQQMEGEFSNALPAHIPVERFTRVVMTAIQNNADLLNCSRRSLWNSAMKAAQDGLLPDGREGAIVPYKGEAQWMPMIAGIRKKVRNSGEIATWDVQAVYANDAFEFELGDDPFIRHKPALGNRGKMIAVYSIATLKSGEKSRDVMGIEEVEAIRAISRSKNGPWANPTFYPEMAKKTVARRHSKVLPMSTDLDDLIRRDDDLYDMAGASDAAVKAAPEPAPKGIGGKLASIAGGKTAQQIPPAGDDMGGGVTVDGEIVRGPENTAQEGGKADEAPNTAESADTPAGDEKNGGSAQSDANTAGDEPTGEQIEAAEARGIKAAQRGATRDAVPPDLKGSERLKDAWLIGYDSHSAAGEGGGA